MRGRTGPQRGDLAARRRITPAPRSTSKSRKPEPPLPDQMIAVPRQSVQTAPQPIPVTCRLQQTHSDCYSHFAMLHAEHGLKKDAWK